MEKKLAVCALIWIFMTFVWVCKAANDGVPLSYGVVASTVTCLIGFIIAWLFIVAFG